SEFKLRRLDGAHAFRHRKSSYSVVLLSALTWCVSPVNHLLVWSDDSGGYLLHLESRGCSGLTLQVVHEAIKKAIDRSLSTRYILYRLEATISRITTFVAQVDKLSEEVEDSSRKIIEDLKNLLNNAASLLNAYAELRRRNLIKKSICLLYMNIINLYDMKIHEKVFWLI
ncbi:unnamed protein product, partial [Brassica oleracea]